MVLMKGLRNLCDIKANFFVTHSVEAVYVELLVHLLHTRHHAYPLNRQTDPEFVHCPATVWI